MSSRGRGQEEAKEDEERGGGGEFEHGGTRNKKTHDPVVARRRVGPGSQPAEQRAELARVEHGPVDRHVGLAQALKLVEEARNHRPGPRAVDADHQHEDDAEADGLFCFFPEEKVE